jgi:hypothetical protein
MPEDGPGADGLELLETVRLINLTMPKSITKRSKEEYGQLKEAAILMRYHTIEPE